MKEILIFLNVFSPSPAKNTRKSSIGKWFEWTNFTVATANKLTANRTTPEFSFSQSASTRQQIVFIVANLTYHYYSYFSKEAEPMCFSHCFAMCFALVCILGMLFTEQTAAERTSTRSHNLSTCTWQLLIGNSDVKSFSKTTLLRPCPTWSLMVRFFFMWFFNFHNCCLNHFETYLSLL